MGDQTSFRKAKRRATGRSQQGPCGRQECHPCSLTRSFRRRTLVPQPWCHRVPVPLPLARSPAVTAVNHGPRSEPVAGWPQPEASERVLPDEDTRCKAVTWVLTRGEVTPPQLAAGVDAPRRAECDAQGFWWFNRSMGSSIDSLLSTYEHAWSRFTTRILGMSDEEYFWDPVPGCWSLRRVPDGTWRLAVAVVVRRPIRYPSLRLPGGSVTSEGWHRVASPTGGSATPP